MNFDTFVSEELCPEDYQTLLPYFKMRYSHTCENILVSNFMWKDYYHTHYIRDDHGLIWLMEVDDQPVTMVPVCAKEDLKHYFDVAEAYFNEVLHSKLTVCLADKEAVELLEKHNDKFEYKVTWGTDLQTEHERYLTEEVFKRPVFVTDYPKEIKAFYMKLNDDGKTVAAVDCLVPGIGEIIGGSQREDDYDKLKSRMDELGLKEEDYKFYMDLRKYGSTRHAGFGLGFERCVMYLTGMGNIRDVIPFPRTVNNCEL